jgi:hypothetical protein
MRPTTVRFLKVGMACLILGEMFKALNEAVHRH